MKRWRTSNNISVTKLLGLRSNVFLVSDGKLNILVDTSPSIFRKILERRLRSLNIDHIDYLVLTHTHFDHVGNAKWIRDKYMAKVFVHRSEEAFLAEGMTPLPSGTNFFTRHLMRSFGIMAAKKMKYDPCPADIIIEDRFDLGDLGMSAYILHTPGHSAGSMTVIVGNEIAIVGDAMVGTFPGMIFPPFADDVPELIQSWAKLLQSGCRVFLPAHGSSNDRKLVEKIAQRKGKKLAG